MNHQPRLLQCSLVLVKHSCRYFHQSLTLLKQRFVLVRQRLNLVRAQHKHIQIDVAVKRQLKVPGAIPQSAARILHITISHTKRLPHLHTVEVRKPRLVNILKTHLQRASLCAAIKEAQIHRKSLLLPITIGLGHKAQILMLLSDILVAYPHHLAPHVSHHACPVTLLAQCPTVSPHPFVADEEEHRLIHRVPLRQSRCKRRVIKVALITHNIIPHTVNRTLHLTLRHLKPSLHVLASLQHKRTSQISIVRIQTIPLGLAVCRKIVVLDAVQVTEPRTQSTLKGLATHAVHHVHSRLAVLGGRYEHHILAVRVCRVAHQHALVALLRFHALKLLLRHHDTGLRHIGHFHPVAPHILARERLAAHQVMLHKHILLLEGDKIALARFLHGLDASVSRAHAYLAAHTPHLLNEQLHHGHSLPHRQFVHRQVSASVLTFPQMETSTQQSVHKLPSAPYAVRGHGAKRHTISLSHWLI